MANSEQEIQNPISNKKFADRKKLSFDQSDKSKKGSYDQPIKFIIEIINNSQYLYTTSSCSGRIIVFTTEFEADINNNNNNSNSNSNNNNNNSNNNNNNDILTPKSSCKWLFTSHTECDYTKVLEAIIQNRCDKDGIITLKFEPLILHIACASIDIGRELLQLFVSCNYRNSGLSISRKGRIILAVRSTQGMEVPIGEGENLLIKEDYLKFLITQANIKLKLNLENISKLETKLKKHIPIIESTDYENESKIVGNSGKVGAKKIKPKDTWQTENTEKIKAKIEDDDDKDFDFDLLFNENN